MSNNALEKPGAKKFDIRSYIQSDVVKKQIALVIPKHLTADVMARVVCTAILKTPKLAECRIESLLQSIMLLSQFGLLPDGRSAHLIPYFNTKANAYDCQAIIDWKGKVARATENGVENIAADVVCFNDKFTWKMTPDGLQFDHEIDFRQPNRGEMFAAYVIWKHGGKFSGVIMTKLEIDNIRKRSKSPDKGPWMTDFSEMAKKTVVHRASKLWPLDAKFKEAIEVQEVNEATIELTALPASEDEPKVIEAADDSNPELNPVAEPLAQGTAEAYKQIVSAGVPFDMFTAEMGARNISASADSWPDFDAVPAPVWETLLARPITLAAIIKKHGKK
jgi:recombination protein RecT